MQSAKMFRRSRYLSAFAHMGDVYLYHDLYGYILKMSPDILAFLAEFREPAEAAEVCLRYANAFDGEPPQQFVDIFVQFACLLESDEDELPGIWYMVPVKSKWNVWRRVRTPEGAGNGAGAGGERVELFTAWGEREPRRLELDAQETAVWDAIDGERRLGEMRDTFDPEVLARLLPRLTHHDVQAVKLSAFPMSTYKGRRNLRPPYLTSTMPYAPCDLSGQEITSDAVVSGESPGTPDPGTEISTTAYYREQITDADGQFDHRETTLSHLLREPHPALGGRTYGQALIDALVARGSLPDPAKGQASVKVLEIGAGLGYVARDAVTRLREGAFDPTYDIVEIAPVLARVQRERLGDLGVTVREGDVLEAELGAGHHLILANEMLGDLPAVQLTRAQIAVDLPPEQRGEPLAQLGEAGELITGFALNLDDAPETFYLTTGALRLVRRLWDALAPGGVCVLTEFGELSSYPRLSTQLDHPELSIHFGHLVQAARTVGFETEFEFIIDLLDFDRDLRGMVTTRSYFRALGQMLAEYGVTLSKVGYTETMFGAILADKVDRATIGELYFDRIEDRLMGLVPHEFKALILKRPE